jgi:uncharacterized protein with HEPN domain
LDNKTIDAVIRNLEIIGEASHLLPDHLKEACSNVDWFRIRGFRNRIVHDYFGVDIEIVWKISCEQIPELITKVKNILQSL